MNGVMNSLTSFTKSINVDDVDDVDVESEFVDRFNSDRRTVLYLMRKQQ